MSRSLARAVRRVAALGAGLVALVGATGATARSAARSPAAPARWLCPARFAPAPAGWLQGSLGPGRPSANSWAHTPGFSDLTDIPGRGVYVWTLLDLRQPTSPAPTARTPLRLPLALGRVDQVATQEGSSLPEYRFAGRHRGYWVDVRVDFGRLHPTPAMRARADALLARLRLPRGAVATPSACRQ